MRLGKCVKSPADLKQYTIEYVHWLNTDEVITDINYEVEAGPPNLVTVDGVQLLNPTKVMAHCPPILRAAGLLGQSIEQSGLLPKALLPLVYVRVATINGCPF